VTSDGRDLSAEAINLVTTIAEMPNAVVAGGILADHYGAVAEGIRALGLLEPNGHESVATSLVDHDDVPVSVTRSPVTGEPGYFSSSVGWVPVPPERLVSFRLSFARLIAIVTARLDLSPRCALTEVVPDLVWEVGAIRLPGRGRRAPIWIARRLHSVEGWQRFAAVVRTRPAPGLRIVLSLTAADRLPLHVLEGHEIIPIRDVAERPGGLVVDADLLAARVASGNLSSDAPISMTADGAAVMVRGKRYAFRGPKQRSIVRQLYQAWSSGNPECLTATILETAECSGNTNTLAKAFSGRDDWREFIKEEGGRCWIYL
jgi:hypothetical protein